MKTKKIYFAAAILLSMFLAVASATSSNVKVLSTCSTSHMIMTNTDTSSQNPHFTCCKCLSSSCSNCNCAGDWCLNGDRLSKSMMLLAAPDYCGANCDFQGQAFVNVFNHNGLDSVNIKLSVNHLYPRNGIFSVWLVNDIDQTKTMQIGMFRTNFMGRASVNFKQDVSDFNMFDGIQIKDMNDNLASSTGLWFNCSRTLDW